MEKNEVIQIEARADLSKYFVKAAQNENILRFAVSLYGKAKLLPCLSLKKKRL